MDNANAKMIENSFDNETYSLMLRFIGHSEIKRLVNQIISAQNELMFKSLAILSEFPGEGKTFFTAALALAYAKYVPGQVLIVNTIPQSKGSEGLLRSVLGVHRPMRRGTDNSSCKVDLITAKNDMRSRWRESPDFLISAHIAKFSNSYDIVFVDTCAMSVADVDCVDPIILAQQVDASILLTSQKSLERSAVKSITTRFKRYGIQPLGSVFNSGALL